MHACQCCACVCLISFWLHPSDVYLLAPVRWVGSRVRCSLGNFLKRFYTSLSRVFLFLFYSLFLLPLTVNSERPLRHPPSFSLHLRRLAHAHLRRRQHVQHATATFPCAFAFAFTLPRLASPCPAALPMPRAWELRRAYIRCHVSECFQASPRHSRVSRKN